MIQTGSNLGPYAREGWAATKPAECPGIEAGKFEHANEISYAILLVRNTPSDQAYKLVVFSRVGNRADFRMRLLDEGDHGARDYYLRKLPLSYFSRESRKKFSMEGPEIILITESGENEAGSEIYYWSGGRYKSDPIDL